MARADRNTIVGKTNEYYSDFLINFDLNPITGNLARVTNEEAVKRSIKQLILTINFERPYDPIIGSKVNGLLFEPIDEITTSILETTITSCIKSREPRANLEKVDIQPRPEDNEYFISIYFSLLNIPGEVFATSVLLSRVR